MGYITFNTSTENMMTNAIETAATMYTVNSIVELLIVAGIVTYLVIGSYHVWSQNRKFNKQWKARFGK